MLLVIMSCFINARGPLVWHLPFQVDSSGAYVWYMFDKLTGSYASSLNSFLLMSNFLNRK